MTGQSEDSDTHRPAPERAEQDRREALDAVSVAAFDVDARIFRTLQHSLTKPRAVAGAALAGDYSQYLSPIRVFVAMFGIQFALAALLGAPITLSIETLSAGYSDDHVANWIRTGADPDIDPRIIDMSLERFQSTLMWPIMVFAALPYLILLKLYRLSLSWWGHLLLYLVPSNGGFLVMIAGFPLLILFPDNPGTIAISTNLAGMLTYFVLTGQILAGFYAKTALGTGMRLFGLVAIFPLTALITVGLLFFSAFWLLDHEFGLAVRDLYVPPE